MLSNTLNTNQVKDSAGTEVEYSRLSISDRSTEFAKIGEQPNLEDRMSIKHTESGIGMKKRRRSVTRFDLTSISGVDSVTPITDSAYLVLDRAIGASTNNTSAANVLARLMSFVASDGSGTTIKYDGTGSGADALLNGGL